MHSNFKSLQFFETYPDIIIRRWSNDDSIIVQIVVFAWTPAMVPAVLMGQNVLIMTFKFIQHKQILNTYGQKKLYKLAETIFDLTINASIPSCKEKRKEKKKEPKKTKWMWSVWTSTNWILSKTVLWQG